MVLARLCTEITTWQELTVFRLNPFELDTILHLEDIFQAHHLKKDDEPDSSPEEEES